MSAKIIKIGINASYLRKPHTGIGQVTLNVVKTLSHLQPSISNEKKIKKDLKFFLYLEEDLPKDFKLPKGFEKRVFLPFYRRDDLIRKIWWEKFLLPKKVKEDECDVFLSLYQCPSIFTPPLNPPLKERGRDRVNHIMIVHDIIPKLFPEYLNNSRKKFYWKLTEKAIKKADKIIAVSKHTKKDLVKYLNITPEKISVNYIDVDKIYKKEVSREKTREVLEKYNLKPGYIYSGGGLEKRKNIENLLKAYKLLSKALQTVNYKLPKLVISGKLMPELAPLMTDVEKLVKDLGLQDKVKLLDFVSQEDLPALYKNAVMFIYPSLYEGFGLPVLEAMNCGTPVIVSNVSSIPEIVSFKTPSNPLLERGMANEFSPFGKGGIKGGFEKTNSCAALLFDPKSPNDMAEKIKKVLSDRNLRNELSVKGKEKAKDFSWKKSTERFFEIIEK